MAVRVAQAVHPEAHRAWLPFPCSELELELAAPQEERRHPEARRVNRRLEDRRKEERQYPEDRPVSHPARPARGPV